MPVHGEAAATPRSLSAAVDPSLTQATGMVLGEEVAVVQLAYNAKTGAIGIRICADDAPSCYFL